MFVFFKQNTAYEMRISDWSSDVCSSDLLLPTLSRLSVSSEPVSRLRHWCSSQYLRISPLHWEFHSPLSDSSLPVSSAHPRLSSGLSHLTRQTAYAPLTPSNSDQRLPTPYYRGCWHGVSRGFFYHYRPIRRGFKSVVNL